MPPGRPPSPLGELLYLPTSCTERDLLLSNRVVCVGSRVWTDWDSCFATVVSNHYGTASLSLSLYLIKRKSQSKPARACGSHDSSFQVINDYHHQKSIGRKAPSQPRCKLVDPRSRLPSRSKQTLPSPLIPPAPVCRSHRSRTHPTSAPLYRTVPARASAAEEYLAFPLSR